MFIKRLPKVIPKIEIPILILQAEKEKIVDNKNLEKLTALFPNAQCKVVFNAKHEVLFEQDELRQETISKILVFLNDE